MEKLAQQGIKAAIIGKVVENGCTIVQKDGSTKAVSEPESDELYKVLKK